MMKSARHRFFGCVTAGICLVLAGDRCIVGAQNEKQSNQGFFDNPDSKADEFDSEPPDAKTTPVKKASTSGATTTLLGEDGKPVSVPNVPSMRGYLEYLRTRTKPRFAVNSIALTGRADRSRAELTATLTVQVIEENAWVPVPLGLNEAVLRGTTYEFLGRHFGRPKKDSDVGDSAFNKRTATEGYVWWFKGKGFHKLTMTLLVPLVKQNTHRRLKLTNPPQTASSTLDLRVAIPIKQLSVTRAKGTPPTIKSFGRSSEISVTGLGDQLDLQWRELPPQRKAGKILQAETYMLLKLSENAAVITAEQRVQASNQVSFSTIEVQLPDGFVVTGVKGQFYKDHSAVDAKNRTTVELTESRTDAKILWTLRRKTKPLDGQLTVQGFQVERARLHSGKIAIEKVQGLQVSLRDAENPAVDRIRVSDFRHPDLVGAVELASAFEFQRQPFQLRLTVTQIKPNITVTPQMTLRIDKDRMELNGNFRVKVGDDGGKVDEMLIEWPNRNAEKWEKVFIDAPGLVESVSLGKKNDRGAIRVKFAKRQNGEFVIPLRATRAITTDGKPLTFSLPTMPTGTLKITTLNVIHNANQEVELKAGDEETAVVDRSRGDANSLERTYDVEQQPASSLMLMVSTHEQKITTSAVVHAAVKSGRVLQVEQRIRYEVAYEPLTLVRFKLPTELANKGLRFFTADEKPASPTGMGLVVGDQTEFSFRLQSPTFGRIEFIARFEIEIKDITRATSNVSAVVPLVECTEKAYSETQFDMQESDTFETKVDDKNWQLVNPLEKKPRWNSAVAITSIPLTLTPTKIPRADGFSISRAMIQTSIDSSGRKRYRAQYRIDSKPTRIVMLFPKELTHDAFWWGDEKIEPQKSENTHNGLVIYRLDLPQAEQKKTRWLTVDFHDRRREQFRWFARHELPVPRFPQNVWIEQTTWRVTLPGYHHAFSEPAGYAARFEWARGMLFWQRQRMVANDAERFSVNNGPAPRQEFPVGNSYDYSCYGPAQTMSIDSMNRSLIVLFGAGFAWIAGILMVKLPLMRSVVALLTAALALAVVGVWYLVQVQVLLQPAILGLFLAALLVWIERRMKRPAEDSAVLTISQPSDFLKPASFSASSSPQSPPYAGSDDATAVRPALLPYQDSNSASDVKSHS